ncbi:serine hydrolase domain-containing protein [Herbaspirillum sp. GCM10030257]|uniref:serine hydrolase domain-containing protein n=1 Tax=Herbaspirillum sp. GCM10030257 TaxID=3273393 RepID=UPI0036136FDD
MKKVIPVLAIATLAAGAYAQAPALPNPAATDPVALGWMHGSPPAADKIIRFEDGSFYRFPQIRWTFSHIRELRPTINVWHGNGAVSTMPQALLNLDAITFVDDKGEQATWADMLQRTYTDSVIVMHKGRVVYEKYFGAAAPHLQHSAFSVTKSFIGLMAAMLVDEGKLDPDALVSKYVPEVKESAYGDATVRQLMDMTIGVRYSENYADQKAEVWDYARAGSMAPVPPTYTGPKNFYDFLGTLKKEGQHGEAFAYKTSNAEMLAWVVRRVAGKPVSDLISEKIWRRLGTESDAYFQVDSIGVESGGGGMSLTLRDMARFGEMMRLDGKFNGQQIVPKAVIEDIRKGGDQARFAKAGYPDVPGYGKAYAYRSMWWISNNAHGVFDARGIHGQRIYIDPAAEMVIAKFSSHPVASNLGNIPLTDRAFAAIAASLSK